MENDIKLTCLVLEPVALVAEDLLTMVEDAMPGTRMLMASTPERAAEILRGHRVDIAFLNLSPLALARTGLVERLEAMRAMVVLMGHEGSDVPAQFRVLELPFVRSTVTHELRTAMQRLSGIGRENEGR